MLQKWYHAVLTGMSCCACCNGVHWWEFTRIIWTVKILTVFDVWLIVVYELEQVVMRTEECHQCHHVVCFSAVMVLYVVEDVSVATRRWCVWKSADASVAAVRQFVWRKIAEYSRQCGEVEPWHAANTESQCVSDTAECWPRPGQDLCQCRC